MSNAEMDYRRKLERYRIGINRSTAIDTNTAAGYFDWMNGELAQMEQEKKNTRVAARVRLRVRLKNLLLAIVAQNSQRVKEAMHGSIKRSTARGIKKNNTATS